MRNPNAPPPVTPETGGRSLSGDVQYKGIHVTTGKSSPLSLGLVFTKDVLENSFPGSSTFY